MGPPGKSTPFEVPDWQQYKVKGCKELELLERMLAVKGLKDPWIRNEVWRYQKSNYPGAGRTAFKSVFRGFKWAVLAVAAGITLENIVAKQLILRDESERCQDQDDCKE